MKKLLSFCAIIISLASLGQASKLQFNHGYIVLDSSDYSALINSSFIKNEFADVFTQSTSSNSASWTATYLFGDINYFEIFTLSTLLPKVGISAIALGSDYSGELKMANTFLSKYYTTKADVSEIKAGDNSIPWFESVYYY